MAISLATWLQPGASSKAPAVTNLASGTRVGHTLVVRGQARPAAEVEVVVEYPRSRLPGYQDIRDVIDTRTVTADARGVFNARFDLSNLPDPSPVELSVSADKQSGQRLSLTVDSAHDSVQGVTATR